jgi:hypothetical protein
LSIKPVHCWVWDNKEGDENGIDLGGYIGWMLDWLFAMESWFSGKEGRTFGSLFRLFEKRGLFRLWINRNTGNYEPA